MKIFPIIVVDAYGCVSTCPFSIKSRILINWFSVAIDVYITLESYRVMKGKKKNKGLYVCKAVIKDLRKKEKEGIFFQNWFQ